MRRKSRQAVTEEKKSAADYYRLNTKAIDDLVTADQSNSPPVSEEELRKYRSGPRIRLSDWLKTTLIKWWFNGAVCFFFLWGLGMAVPSMENQLIILGIGLGLVTDLLVNSIFRYYAKTQGANDRWMMVHRKGAAGLFLNVIYAYIILACVVMTYQMVNGVWAAHTGVQDQLLVGVEPVLFGFLAMAWDMALLGCRHLMKRIVADAKKQSR